MHRVRKASIVSGLLLGVFIATYGGVHAGGAWLISISWSLVNLLFIEELVKNALIKEKKNLIRIILVGAIKFPMLYTLGFITLASGVFPVAWLLIGFSWPLFVCTLKALGRVVLHMDETESAFITRRARSN